MCPCEKRHIIIQNGRQKEIEVNTYVTRVGTISQTSSEISFKLSRFTVGLSHLEKLSFAQASAHIASTKTKKSEWWQDPCAANPVMFL